MEILLTIICWFIAAVTFLFWGLCLYTTNGVALRFAFTGKTGSGLPIVGSVVATIGLLIVPVGSFADRLTWSWVPIAFEAAIIAVLQTVCWFSGRKLPR